MDPMDLLIEQWRKTLLDCMTMDELRNEYASMTRTLVLTHTDGKSEELVDRLRSLTSAFESCFIKLRGDQ